MPEQDRRIALVTGGNKGIGFAIARGLAQSGDHVLIGARDAARGAAAAATLRQEGLAVDPLVLERDRRRVDRRGRPRRSARVSPVWTC